MVKCPPDDNDDVKAMIGTLNFAYSNFGKETNHFSFFLSFFNCYLFSPNVELLTSGLKTQIPIGGDKEYGPEY